MRPRIAVVGSLEQRAGTPELVVPVVYLEAVERAGGVPVVLHPERLPAGEAAGVLASIDGLLLTGGGDVDPGRYGQTPGAAVYGVSQVRDGYELALIEAAEERNLPLLAICRGLQVLNVARGGTLQQHISDPADLDAHGTPNGGQPALHTVHIEPGSKVAEAMGVVEAESSCHHHQAVAALGHGLKPAATASDGLVEALETDSGDVLAVQWHPEDTAASDPAQQRLFDWLVGRAGLLRSGDISPLGVPSEVRSRTGRTALPGPAILTDDGY